MTKSTHPSYKEDFCIFGAFFALLVLVWGLPFFVLGSKTLPSEALLQYYPWRYAQKGTEMGYIANPVSVAGADSLNIGYPHDVLYNHEIQNGRLSLWNPNVFCGAPAIGTSVGGSFCPTKMLFHRLFSTGTARQLEVLLMQFLGGLGMALYCRSLRLSRSAAIVAGTGWTLGGYNMAWQEVQICGEAAAWLGFSLWSLTEMIRTRNPAWTLGAGVSLGLLGLSGHPQLTAMGWAVSLSWTAYFLVSEARDSHQARFDRSQLWLGLRNLALATAIGLCLCAPQALPTLEWSSLSSRPSFSAASMLEENRLLPHHLLTLFFPEVWGRPSAGFQLLPIVSNIETPEEFWMYSGWLVTIFSLFGVFQLRRETVFFGGLILLCVSIACGSPVYHGVLYLLPGLGSLVPGRVVWLISLSLCVLSGFGVDRWLEQSIPVRLRYAVAGLVVMVAGFVCYWCWSISAQAGWPYEYAQGWLSDPQHIRAPNYTGARWFAAFLRQSVLDYYALSGRAVLHFVCLTISGSLVLALPPRWKYSSVLAIALLSGDLLFEANSYHHWTDQRILTQVPASVSLLKQGTLARSASVVTGPQPNALTSYGIDMLDGYSSLPPRRLQTLLRQSHPNGSAIFSVCRLEQWQAATKKLSEIASCGWLLTDPTVLFKIDDLKAVNSQGASPELVVYENTGALPRAYLVENWRTSLSAEEGSRLLLSPEIDIQREAIVEGPVGSQQSQLAEYVEEPAARGGPRFDPGLDSVRNIPRGKRYQKVEDCQQIHPQRWELNLKCERKSILVVTNGYHPGWQCQVDSQPASIYPANVAFWGVPLEPGQHHVVFEFRSNLLTYAIYVSLVTLICCVCSLLYFWRSGQGVQLRPSSVD